MPAGFICLPAARSLHWTIHLHKQAPSSALHSILTVGPYFDFFFTFPPSFLTSLTFTHWSLCHFLNNDPGAGGTTAYLYFITVNPCAVGLGWPVCLREVRRESAVEEGRGKGGVAHGNGEGGGCTRSIMTDTSPDVTIRAQSKHINDQPMATL